MAEEFLVKIGTELDTASIDNLKQKISGIKTNPVKIKIDTSDVTSQINKIKNQIQNLSGIKINLTGGNVGGGAVKNVSEVTKAYNDLMRIQKQLNSTRIKINGLDAIKDSKQIGTLSGQLQRLQVDYNNLYQTFNKHFSTDQLDNLNRVFEATSNQISATNAKMADTSAIKQQEAAYKELLNVSQQISKIELKIGGLKGIGSHSNEVAELEGQLNNLRNTYQQLATSMQGNLSTDQLRTLSQQTYDTADKLNVLNAKIQDTKQKLANTSLKNFANDAGKIDKISEQFANLKNKTAEVRTVMEQFSKAVNNMKVAKESGDVDKIVQSYKKYENAIKRVNAELKRISSVDSLNQACTSLSSQMDVWLNNNSAAVARFGSQIKALQKELVSCDATRLNGIKTEFTEITRQAQIAGVATQSFGDKFKEQLSKLSTYFSANMLIMTSIRGLREMYQNVMDIDTAFTELKKVTDETDASYDKFLSNAASNAKEIGTTIDNYITSSADFARLGYTFDQSQELAKVANIYNVVGDEIADVNEATQSIISTMKAFGVEADNAISIVDKANEVGNRFVISSGGIGEALKRSASSMAAANNTMDETIALITAANTVVQDPSRVGNAFKTMSMRIRGAETELEEAGLDAEGMAESTAKLREEIMALSGVDIMINDDTFKSTYRIIDELSAKWQDLTDIQQASITELIAGKHQGNVMSSLMNNFDIARQALDVSLNSEGSAMKEHEKWMESLEAKVNVLKATFQSLSTTFLKSDFLKGLIEGLNSLVNTADVVIDKVGVIPALIGAISIALSFKGKGFVRLNTEADGFINRLNLMNVNLGNVKKSISNTFFNSSIKSGLSNIKNGIKNFFNSPILSEKDLKSIKAYNSEIDRLSEKVNQNGMSISKHTIAQKANNKTMSDASDSAKALVKNANDGKVSISNLGASMLVAKAKTIGLQIATTALNIAISMGLTVAISAVISAISDYIHKEEEARQKALEAGEAAKEESKQISELYSAYEEVSKAHKNGEASYGDMYKAAYDLCDALGVERSELHKLVEEYGNLDAAMRAVSTQALEDNLGDLLRGYDAAKENLVKAANDVGWWQSSNELHYKNDKGFEKIKDALIGSKFATSDDFVYGLLGGSFMKLNPIENEKDAIKRYEKLVEMREYITELAKSGELGINVDDLSGIDFFKNLGERIDESEESVEKYNESVKGVIENLENVEFNKFVSENGIPEIRADFEKLRDSIIETVEEQGNFTENQEDLKTSVDEFLRSKPGFEKFFYTYNEGLVSICNGIDAVIDDIDELTKSSTSAYDSVSAINKLLNEQTTGIAIPINEDNMGTMLAYGSAIEYVNGVMQLNSDKAKEIANAKVEEQIATNAANKEARQAQYIENSRQIEEYTDKLFKLTDLRSEEATEIRRNIDNLTEENSRYLDECTQLDILNSSLRESVSLYSDWKNAQNAAESGDMFDDTKTAFKEINDALNDNISDNFGKVGREHYKASVDLIIPNSIDKDDEAAINSYINSIEKFFTFDETKKTELEKQLGDIEYKASIGEEVDQSQIDKIYADLETYEKQKLSNIDGLNINALCEEAVRQGLMVFDEATDEYNLAGKTLMKDFANGMGLSMPIVQAMFGELEEYGVEFDWADEIPKTFGDGILEAQSKINELQLELNDLKYDIRIGVEVDPSRVDELNAKLDEAKQKRDELTQSSEDNILANIDLDEQFKQAQATFEGWTAKLQSGDFSNISKVEVEANISNAQSDIERIQQEKEKLQEPTLVEVNAVTGNLESKIESLQAQADRYKDKEYCASFKMDDEDARAAISRLNSQIREANKKRIKVEAYAKTNKANDELDVLDDRKLEDKDVTVIAHTDDAHRNLCEVEDDVDRLNSKSNPTITVTTIEKTLHEDEYPNQQSVGGNSHASGTAKAGGDWGNKHPGKTLVGELGREIIIDVHSGRWHTVGDNGAEFVDVPKGAIVFNHLQTEELLSKGFVASRAMALASGNAFASGNAKVSLKKGIPLSKTLQPLERNAARNATVVINNSPNATVVNGTVNTENPENQSTDANTQAEIPYNPNDPNAQYLLDPGTSEVEKEKEKEKTALDRFKEWFSSLFDWLEIQMKNHSDRIDKYIKKAEDAKSSGRYNAAAKNYTLAIDETSRQAFDQKKAVRKYSVQASTILDTAVAQGVITDGESSIIKRGVQTGDMDISQYCDEVQEVIKSYQTWYEKSKDAKKSLDNLHANVRNYINDLKDLRIAQRDASLDRIETAKSIGGGGFAFSYGSKNSLLKYNNSQLNKQNKVYDKYVSNIEKDIDRVVDGPGANLRFGWGSQTKKYRSAIVRAEKAIKAKKPVSNSDLNIIKARYVHIYEKLYAYNESLKNLETAKLERALNYATNSSEKFSNMAQMYENKEQKLNDNISLYKTKSSNAISAKNKNVLLDKAAIGYDSIVTNSKKKVDKFISQVNDISRSIARAPIVEGRKKTNNLINNVHGYVGKGVIIPPNVLSQLSKYIGNGIELWFYQSCIDYNNALEYKKEAEEQYEIAKQMAIQEKADIGVERFNNVKQEYTNKQDINQSNRNKESIRHSIKTTKGLDLTASDYQNLKTHNRKDREIYNAEANALEKTIKENLSKGNWKKGSQEYIDATLDLEEIREKILECAEEEERLNNEIAALPYSAFERAIDMIQTLRSNMQSLLAIKTTRGISKTEDDIDHEIKNINDEIEEQIRRREKLKKDYQTALSNPDGVYGGKKAEEWLKEYYEADTEINKLRESIESLNNEAAQLPYDAYEKALSLLDSIASYNKSISDLTRSRGFDLTESDYLREINNNNNKIKKYEEERRKTYNDYLKALSDSDKVYGGMSSDEWLIKYNDLGATINGIKSDNEDIRDAMRDDVYWRTFERAHNAAQALKDILSGIADLIDDDMLYDKDGNFTDYGVAQMANIVKQFETARKEVQNYTNDIQNLNSLYARGYYNQDEFNEKLNELQNGLFDSASAMKSYISEIIDMNKKLAQSELDALFKLIDARNDALTAKKNYYDYDKTIKDKTKDIQALQAQIGALEGIETAEAKAQKARLEADLSDKKDDLNDTIMNHSFELSKDALDELKTILQDEFDERWDNIGQDLNEIQKLITAANELTAAQSHTVGSALNKLLSFYGINPTSTDLNQFGNVTGYASGTRKVDKDKVAWTQEDGGEVVIRKSDGAILTPLSRGDSVIPNDLTNNLFDWGMHNPQEFADSLVRGIPDVPKVQSQHNSVNVQLGNMVNIEGNVVKEELPKLKNILDMAYKHTVNEIAKDARKKGIKP